MQPTVVTVDGVGVAAPSAQEVGAELLAPSVFGRVTVAPTRLEAAGADLLFAIAPVLVWVTTACAHSVSLFEVGSILRDPASASQTRWLALPDRLAVGCELLAPDVIDDHLFEPSLFEVGAEQFSPTIVTFP